MDQSKPLAIFLMGPTASGKTDLAIQLVEQMNCEIISVDSALIYRGMDIGTAKPGKEELARAPHRLIDIREPSEVYSASEFRRDALEAMREITQKGRIPLLVGGTMMYFKALRQGIACMPAADPAMRAQLEEEAARKGWLALHEELQAVDPQAAEKIHPNNHQRLLRALEVCRLSGKPLSDFWRGANGSSSETSNATPQTQYVQWEETSFAGVPCHVVNFAVSPRERKELHQRIEARFRKMLALGFLDEVERLRARGDLHPDLPSVRCVGYRQAWDYLDGRIGYQEMIDKGIAATRQLAKRQLTWLRSWPDVHWLETGREENLLTVRKLVEGLS